MPYCDIGDVQRKLKYAFTEHMKPEVEALMQAAADELNAQLAEAGYQVPEAVILPVARILSSLNAEAAALKVAEKMPDGMVPDDVLAQIRGHLQAEMEKICSLEFILPGIPRKPKRTKKKASDGEDD